MNKKINLTIFTPTYNRCELLKKAYNSLLNQSSKNFVWLIVDDGSSDNTKKEVEKWIKEDKIKIRYYYKSNGGKHTAFNFMLDVIDTDYVLVSLDSDDVLIPTCVEEIHKDIDRIKSEVGIVYPRSIEQAQNKISKNFNSLNDARESLKYICSIGKMDMETEIVFLAKYLKKFKYPVFENEKFITESYIYYQMTKKMLWRNIPICVGKYQADGLTLNAINLFFKNPNGWYEVNKIRMNLKKSFVLKIKYRIYYITFGILSHKKGIVKNVNKKILTLLFFPIGYFCSLYLKYKFNKKNSVLKFIIRLDDACPWMKKDNWDRMEKVLDMYNIRPIVGVIPECKDMEFLKNKMIKNFWNLYPKKWQKKGWIIAQHGFNHNLTKNIRTEFKGKSYDEQMRIVKNGLDILKSKGVKPICFFAPNHTFDDNTIKVCKNIHDFRFISDGCAYFPYSYNGVMFVPSVFDTPHKISRKGIFTFVYHPNNMTDKDFEYLENFIKNNLNNFELNLKDLLYIYRYRNRTIKDKILHLTISLFRFVRKIVRGG